MNLITSYFAAMSDKSISKGRAIDLLNKACGKNYNHSRMAEFERGVHTPPASVIRYMAHKSIHWILHLSPDIQSDKQIVDALTPPEPKEK